MRRTRRAQQTAVALEIKVKLGGTDDVGVDDSPGRAVSTLVCVAGSLREEADMVTLAHDDHRDGGVDLQFFASS